jgi:ribonuclease P protein subunit POP4
LKITPRNLIHHELIGLRVYVEESMNESMKGIKGEIVDETMNMITILDTEGEVDKRIPKSTSIFIFTLPDGASVRVDGRILVGRPEDRVQRRRT